MNDLMKKMFMINGILESEHFHSKPNEYDYIKKKEEFNRRHGIAPKSDEAAKEIAELRRRLKALKKLPRAERDNNAIDAIREKIKELKR